MILQLPPWHCLSLLISWQWLQPGVPQLLVRIKIYQEKERLGRLPSREATAVPSGSGLHIVGVYTAQRRENWLRGQRGGNWLRGQHRATSGISGTVDPRGLDRELLILQPPTPNCSNIQVHPPLGFCGAGDSTKASSVSGKHSASWATSSAPL